MLIANDIVTIETVHGLRQDVSLQQIGAAPIRLEVPIGCETSPPTEQDPRHQPKTEVSQGKARRARGMAPKE